MNGIIDQLKESIKQEKTRSTWGKGKKEYALELVEELENAIDGGYFDVENLQAPIILEKQLLNGAENWNQYSWGGCSLIYDTDIALRLCNPTELKRTNNGEKSPNSNEEWLDVQARALLQAAHMIRRHIRHLTGDMI